MFEFSSHIRMLELVLCLGQDGAQDPGFLSVIIQAAILWIIVISYLTHRLDGCDHTRVYLSILTGWLRPCLGSGLLYTLLWMAAPIPHIYHVSEILVVFLYAGFPTAVFSVGHVLVNHFTPLSPSGLML